MPKYRKLHVKATESLDINDMPDDFTRLLWLLLTLAVDAEGRGLDNANWIKAKTMPLRDDVIPDMIEAAFNWYAARGMVIRYEVDGRHYFCIPTWHDYQGDTAREAPSYIPEYVNNGSRVGNDMVMSGSGRAAYAYAYESESVNDLKQDQKIQLNPVGVLHQASGLAAYPADQLEWIEVVVSLVETYGEQNAIRVLRSSCIKWCGTKNKNGNYYKKTDLRWINWAQEELARQPAEQKTNMADMTAAEMIEYVKRQRAQNPSDALPG